MGYVQDRPTIPHPSLHPCTTLVPWIFPLCPESTAIVPGLGSVQPTCQGAFVPPRESLRLCLQFGGGDAELLLPPAPDALLAFCRKGKGLRGLAEPSGGRGLDRSQCSGSQCFLLSPQPPFLIEFETMVLEQFSVRQRFEDSADIAHALPALMFSASLVP